MRVGTGRRVCRFPPPKAGLKPATTTTTRARLGFGSWIPATLRPGSGPGIGAWRMLWRELPMVLSRLGKNTGRRRAMQNGRTSGSSRAGDKPRYIFFLDHEMPIERFGKRCGLGEASRYIFIRITMALRRPHKTIKMMVRRAVFFRLVVLLLPTPSGFQLSLE